MNPTQENDGNGLPNGVMLNIYPDSIGKSLADTVSMLRRPEFKDAFSLLYILPSFFNSDLDRGFSVINYNRDENLSSAEDLESLHKLKFMLKFDMVLNHLSVNSPQFQDLLLKGDQSRYKDLFIDWNQFWADEGEVNEDGCLIPKPEHLDRLFMRKPGLPVLMVRFPDGTDRPFWNTFYQEITYRELFAQDLSHIDGLNSLQAETVTMIINAAIREKVELESIDLSSFLPFRKAILTTYKKHRKYLGQMDVNAQSEQTWVFFEETLKKLSEYGCKLVRLDAFAYLHKEPGQTNFFNKPGTWAILDRLRQMASKYDLVLLPEIHSEYGCGIHEQIASKGFPIYDFFFPGLVIDALDRGCNTHLLRWINELVDKGLKTINMLGCHDGIPVLDLKGKEISGFSVAGLLSDDEIGAVIDRILNRGGRIKNLFGPDGKEISYYQVNATFFSALGEDEKKMLLARAIQLFTPGIPQVWYLDLFVGRNDYEAADHGGSAGHKEINRTTLSLADIEYGLKKFVVKYQLQLIQLRNNCPAFQGKLTVGKTEDHLLELTWANGPSSATLKANLCDHVFTIDHQDDPDHKEQLSFN
ncbi:MAG: glycosidase [Magnetococcales bacterium]|nr:glycosidase [Magnetococcales bacterium]